MTGFGRATSALGETGGELAVEVRSVNGRHLDVRFRAPRELAGFEGAVRELVSESFSRGSVEVSVRTPQGRILDPEVEIDMAVARRYADAARALAGEGAGPLDPAALLSLPGVARLREPELGEDVMRMALAAAVREACLAAAEMRKSEGEALAAEVRRRVDRLRKSLSDVEARAEEIQRGLRARLEKRLAALAPDLELQPGRVEQEVVIFVDRMDVTEETVRFRSHLVQLDEALGTEGPVGRKLEFLLQEIGREVNTIGSKAADAPVAHSVVELKTELEKLREQIMNVE